MSKVESAGTKPGGKVKALSAESLLEVGVDITGEHTRQLTEEMIRCANRVVVLGLDAQLEPVDDTPVEIWETDEPSERGIGGIQRMRLVRDDITLRVGLLAQELLHTPS